MKRLHLFEFEDQFWFPSLLRNYMTDFLRHATLKLGLDRPLVSLLQRFLDSTHQSKIIDLCSGGGGLLVALQDHLNAPSGEPIHVCFTDKYPNHDTLIALCDERPDIRTYVPSPIDARAVPSDLRGLRTLFSAFHHFAPPAARQILRDAQKDRVPIAIIEVSERSFRGLLAMMLAPLAVFILTPGIRPRRLSRFALTYVLPLIPFFILWDGVVSALRTYSLKELEALRAPLHSSDYVWQTGKTSGPHGYVITYMFGFPQTARPLR